MRRMPILVRPKPFLPRRCLRGIYAGLARLSAGCPPDKGRLHTCYSPVRHSPAGGASSSPAAVRLACVKPAASVHPEPGSNSPLLVIYCYISFLCLFVLTYGSCFLYILYSLGILTGNSSFVFPCLILDHQNSVPMSLLVLWHFCQCSLFASRSDVVSFSVLRLQSYCRFCPCANFVETFFHFSLFTWVNSLIYFDIKFC